MKKVIVAITTYNLEKYISQALDSVLMQKTSFDFLIKVADDCSTDRTIEILKEYKNRYPTKIELLFADNNMGSLANSNRLFDHIDCEYLSFLDGDDYWIDEHRLQEQVEFLDSHPEYTLIGGNTQLLKDGVLSEFQLDDRMLGKSFSFEDYLNGKIPCVVHTSSILLRNVIFKHGLPDCYSKLIGTFEESAVRGEDFRRLLHLKKGLLFVEDKIRSIYRIHEGGTWQGSSLLRVYLETVISYNFYIKYFGKEHSDFFMKKRDLSYGNLMAFMLSNKLLMNSNRLPSKDATLFGGLMADMARNNSKSLDLSYHKYRMHLFRILLKLGLF